MKYAPILFGGILACVGASWWGTVALPVRQLASLRPFNSTNDAGVISQYPVARPGSAAQGREVYVSLGCSACHSQQVRDGNNGSDIARGWGVRRTVARDYLFDEPVQLGASRLGPDLANYGARLGTNAFSMVRLYNPRLYTPGSMCPGAPSLFDDRPVRATGPSADALKLPAALAPAPGRELVPSVEAWQLAAYLRSLKVDADLPEAPVTVAEGGAKP
jgi:cytochrome c oxidase cbb3-type subunit II